MLLTCSYREQEFIRVGYYVNNELPGEGDGGDGTGAASNTAMTSAVHNSGNSAASAVAGTPNDPLRSDKPASNDNNDNDDIDDMDDMDEDENVPVEGIEEDAGAMPVRHGPVDPSLVVRNVLASKPRVTRFQIQWD